MLKRSERRNAAAVRSACAGTSELPGFDLSAASLERRGAVRRLAFSEMHKRRDLCGYPGVGGDNTEMNQCM
jgi:hypothetical protein